jgi:hypothetical protein
VIGQVVQATRWRLGSSGTGIMVRGRPINPCRSAAPHWSRRAVCDPGMGERGGGAGVGVGVGAGTGVGAGGGAGAGVGAVRGALRGAGALGWACGTAGVIG